ncbi:hypothetical protein [Aequorivita antarctica]|uniref:Uncharacterized protein n=1 Tax=Aequorivita antarctica TaxID=153266 RepID=A0A5C6YX26_9FLAO|nr:hypothetical protein [Aequorivita antarctica]TXD72247.1 hypothetical protein ESU54_12520 [Aequorivita antarctica]SRX74377.1 hypothetical protein AEQU3_01355 [Aequorivita antarctica]
MKENEAKQLEHLVAKAMQKSTLESPSLQFTNKVMAAINAEQHSVAVRYRPLIPIYIWIAIAALVVGFTSYIWFVVQPTPLDLPTFSFNFMENNLLSKKVAAMSIPKITGYAVMLLALMLCIQIPMLKRYFDKRQFV